MKSFMDENFLLTNKTSEFLYHMYAKKMPIIDYRCHFPIKEIARHKVYSNISELWIMPDCHKLSAMRSCGIDERYITGDASDYERLKEFCRAMPKMIGNPIYQLSHIELRRYFDCDLIICEKNCDEIWKLTSKRLRDEEISAKSLILKSNVKLLCTTDDPADSLEFHESLSNDDSFNTKILPTFCPDKAFEINKAGIREYIFKLGETMGKKITDMASFLSAMKVALDRFDTIGCKSAYHTVCDYVEFVKPDEYHASLVFKKAFESDGKEVSQYEAALFKSEMMYFFGKQYKSRGWIMQLYLVDNNSVALSRLIDYLKNGAAWPNTALCSVGGGTAYNLESVQGRALLFNDCDDMSSQICSLAKQGALGASIGMISDSYTLMPYSRHEYFRRVLCDAIGKWVEEGLYPANFESLAQLVCDICYNNGKKFFGFQIK